ncbi:MAG: MBL fold metallo-hydrolase [Candidatus Thermoplasmatota archaeon]|nr:MBL fold metallo-hydrolase [Candidatus Thermoplasmatota archaeon]
MLFEQLNEGVWAMTYLIVDETTREAALVDPVYDYMDAYLERLEKDGLTLVYAIATHTHADHITACFSLREQLGCDYVMSHETASLGVSMHMDDEEKIMLGSIPIQFHAAPGHTNDSMIVHVPGYMMTGDFLFNGDGGVGRDDLPSGRVQVHWEALKVLERFEGHTVVCSGHDPPGTEMKSLDWNRDHNPVLSMTSFESFKAWQEATAAKLGGVSKIKTAIPANLFGEVPEHIPWLD